MNSNTHEPLFPYRPNIISNVSVASSDSGVSPVGVADIDLMQSSAGFSDWSSESMFLETTTPYDEIPAPPSFDGLSEDPLEWLLGGGLQHLPESSLNPSGFPEFDPMDCPEPVTVEETSSTSSATAVSMEDQAPPSLQHSATTTATTTTNTADTTLDSATATLNMADPKVSVQSLFLEA